MLLKPWVNFGIAAAYVFEVSSATIRFLLRPVPLLAISVVLYNHSVGIFGTSPMTAIELVEYFSSNYELLIGLLGLVVAIIAAQSFMESKRLDMRLSAATDIQGVTERACSALTQCELLASSLQDAHKLVRSNVWKHADPEDQIDALEDVMIGVKITLDRGRQAQADLWKEVFEVISINRRHRLAITSSAVCHFGMKFGLRVLESAAESASKVQIPQSCEDPEDFAAWAYHANPEGGSAFIAASQQLIAKLSLWLGAAIGAIGHGVFPNSALALLSEALQLYNIQKEARQRR